MLNVLFVFIVSFNFSIRIGFHFLLYRNSCVDILPFLSLNTSSLPHSDTPYTHSLICDVQFGKKGAEDDDLINGVLVALVDISVNI